MAAQTKIRAIITLTKHMNKVVEAGHPAAESGAGAPTSFPPSEERNVLLRDVPPLHSFDAAQPPERVSPPAPYQEPVVQVLVSGRPLGLPEFALREALSQIRLTTEAHVRVEDYAEGVALVLSALARNGTVIVPA
jgi:hypothetical protein